MNTDELLRPLSSLHEEAGALQAARRLLDDPDRDGELERLYPGLLRHHLLLPALAHLERAGGDLERLTIPTALFLSTPKLNRLVPVPDESSPGQISLLALRHRLEAHQALLRRTLGELIDLDEEGRLIVLSGRAIQALYPDYAALPRAIHDVDVFTPDLASGLRILNGVWNRLGFALQMCMTSPADGGWVAHFALFRVSDEGFLLRIDLIVGGRPIDRDWSPPCLHPQLAARARCVRWDGRQVLVPSPEDILLMLAEKSRLNRKFTLRHCADARFLLTVGPSQLNWDYLTSAVRHRGLAAAMHVLVDEAERQERRRLVPARIMRGLAPGLVERLVIPAIDSNGATLDRRSELWCQFWFVQQMGARLARPRSMGRLLLDRLRLDRHLDLALESWCQLSGKTLILDNTQVSDMGLARLKGSAGLETLSLGGTGITDLGLEHLKGLIRLERLYLFKTAVTDAGLEHLKGLTGLRCLHLEYTAVTDAGLAHLQGLKQLQTLCLDGTGITDAGLEHLKGLTGLRCLHLQYTGVTDSGVEDLQRTLPELKIERTTP
jgi:hypothetical protein